MITTATMNSAARVAVATLMLSLASGLAACHAPEPRSPDVGLTKPVDPPVPPDLGRGATRMEVDVLYSMYVDDSVRSTCAGPSPFFKLDSSKPAGNEPTLQTLVNCMISGPLKGRSIKLIGRTDPRGTEDYNEKLGLERAEKVKKYLVTNGVDGDRVQTESLGKEDASPAPKDWAGDRRVEIQLVK